MENLKARRAAEQTASNTVWVIQLVNRFKVRPLKPYSEALMADVMDQGFLTGLQKQFHDRFGIDHSTIQVEREGGNSCMLDKRECE